jgi:hypothetical protein
MPAPPFVPALLAIAVAATAAGCNPYPYGTRGYDYGPSFERVPGYQPGYAYRPASGDSKWDYYRNYQGSFRTPPEKP